ncbi:retrovirus-related pol polyprotein from transposon TNT 1-94 [Tanacetum coccineum]
MGTFRETLTEGNEGALHLGPERARVYSDLSPDDKDRYNADIRAISQGNNPTGAGAAGNRGAQNRVGNANLGQARHIKCYNCNGIEHIARNFTQPKRPKNSDYFKDKILVMQAQENRVVLDEEQSDECDAFDSDVDEAPTAQTMMLFVSIMMHHDVQPNYVVDSNVDYMSGSTMILYDHYAKDNAEPVVQSNVSSVPNDAYLMIINEMQEQTAQSVSANDHNKVVNASLAAELATYKEQFELCERRANFELTKIEQKIKERLRIRKVAIGYKNPLCLTRAKQVQPALYNGHEIIKTHHVPTIVHNSENTLEIAEITRKKMNDKMKTPLWTEQNINIRPSDYSKENYLATFTPQTQLTLEQIFWSKDVLKMKSKALKEQTTTSRPIKALTVYPPNTHATLVPKLEAEVDQNVVNRKYDEIERKNILIANDNLIADCLSKEVFYIAINSELTVSRFTEMHDAHTVVQAGCLELEVELFKLHDKDQKDDHIELVKLFSNLEITRAKYIEQTIALLTENENLKAQIHENMKCITMDSVKPIVLAPGRVSSCTDASGSKPRSNTKKNKILPAKSVNKKKVEEHHRTNKSSLNNTNRVDSSISFKLKKVWKPKQVKQVLKATGKLLTNVGYQWKPTGRIFTLGEQCPLTRLTKSNVMPVQQTITLVVQIVLWYLDSGSSKHVTGDCSWLRNFVKRFIRTIRFENDHFGAIMGYGDYVIGDCVISKEAFMLCLLEVKFLRSKDETPEFVIKFLKQIQIGLNKTVRYIHTDNGTEFVNQVLTKYYESVGIFQQKSVPRTLQQNGVVERQNRTLVEAARTMLIFSKAPMFLWAEAVATACYTQNQSLIHTRHNKTPYELVHDKKSDLTFLQVFDANDGEDLRKLQPTTDIRIFIRLAPFLITLGQIRSGLVPNLIPTAPYVPPTNKDLEILFQPMFDENLEPPRVERLVPPASAVQVPVNLAGSPSFTTIDQDAPSASHSPSSSALQSLSSHQGVAAGSTIIKDNHFPHADNDPFVNVFAPEPSSEASSSGDASSPEPTHVTQPHHHFRK